MLILNLAVWAAQLGFFEVGRDRLMSYNRTLACDDVMRWCSTLVAKGVFEGPGRICASDDDEEEQQEDPASRAWDVNLPLVLAASDAQGFGLATSQRAWRTALERVALVERSKGLKPEPVPLAATEGDESMLHAIEPRLVRVCHSLDGRWMVCLPVVMRVRKGSVEQLKMELCRQNTIVDSEDFGWWMLPENDVYAFVTDRPDAQSGRPVSKVQRQLPERATTPR